MPPAADRPPSRTLAWLVLAGTIILATAALMSVLNARFDTGDSYPAYSSLRTDPLGTRALFESLGSLPDVKSVRQFERLEKLQGAPRQTLLLCGVDPRSLAAASDSLDARALTRFAAAGGRLVIALNPSTDISRIGRAYKEAKDENEKEDDGKEASPDKKDLPEDKAGQKKKKSEPSPQPHKDTDKTSLASLIKISAKSREFYYQGKEGSPLKLAPNAPLRADVTPPWFSNVFLDDDPAQDWQAGWEVLIGTAEKSKTKDHKAEKPAENKQPVQPVEPSPWHVIATKGDRNMIMERSLGSGSVVVCTDRYFLSNEALWKGPSTQFLSWLLGNPSVVIFEETHLGPSIGDADGIMTLARRYRMHGLFLGGILLFALYIWRNAASLVPANPDDDLGYWRDDAVAGQSTASALEGLLRRGIRPANLLTKSLDVWEESRVATATVPVDRRTKARALLAAFKTQKQAPQAYNQIRDALHPARSQPPSSTTDHP